MMARIPRSTLHDWKHKIVTELMGYDWYCEQQPYFTTLQAIAINQRLMLWNRALLRLIALRRFMKKCPTQMENRLFHAAEVVVHTIQKIQAVAGLNFTLKALSLSHRQYWRVRQKIWCAVSVLNRCLIKHPAQFAKQEVRVIKGYCMNCRLLHWPLSSIYHQLIRETSYRFQLSTFYKYVRLLGVKRTTPIHRRKNHATGIRSQNPLELLIEAAHKKLKYRFLYHKIIPDIDYLRQYPVEAIDGYNNRPNAVLDGLTPFEVLAGKSINKQQLSIEMQAACTARIAVNQQYNCCECSF
ncbi:hypothetical protein [Flavihumibacter sp. CACIAM 22H1]|uniref:hypothetical protein n=1 Tax=Flavihumibacter sp. CACIAM 22H1 TaxID=1812911 RepID=UPI0007A85DA3|nr:hypothetical protein [Flavihumibacter sp. CACIAM 22H1]KYP13817.1 MAG: hypothetical protein A1D16_11415 [Flavihumibacter sp. CACIAM 22H1]